MRRSSRSGDGAVRRRGLRVDEAGSASLEFIAVGALMLVPLAYLMIALGAVQAQTLGIESIARFAARAVGNGQDPEDTVRAVADQYGIEPDGLRVTVACTPVARPCPAAGSTVLLTVRTEVSLPVLPDAFGLDRLASVPIEATAAHKASRFWDAG